MKVVKCNRGHFFDIDTYDECPICGSGIEESDSNGDVGGSSNNNKPSTQTGGTSAGLKGLKKFFAKTSSPATEVRPIPSDVDVKEDETEKVIEESIPIEDEKTEYMFSNTSSQENVEPIADEITEAMFSVKKTESKESAAYSVDPKVESLQDAVKQISASDDGKTMSFFSATLDSISNSEVQASKNVEPVVGWLVGISGSHFGEAFVINAGMNSIGRNASNNIVIGKDGTVSREKHAFIIYEPKRREFFVKPGESSGLTYINDEYIAETKKIQDRDILEIGGTKLLFIPLCSEDFSWEDYVSEN